jgi:hypothetical protein
MGVEPDSSQPLSWFGYPLLVTFMRTQVIRSEVLRLIHQTPFRPFAMSLENGDRIIVGHPENFAFDPTPEGPTDFYAFSG